MCAADFSAIKDPLGAQTEGDALIIPVFGTPYTVSAAAISDPSGQLPSMDVCVLLSKYILLCPDPPPTDTEWVSFKDFKDSGPLIGYFSNNVEGAVAASFSGRPRALRTAGKKLGGMPPQIDVQYDVSMRFQALPRFSLMLLFNDADDEFPVACSILFERRAETHLDAECLAMAGNLLARHLKRIDRQGNRAGIAPGKKE